MRLNMKRRSQYEESKSIPKGDSSLYRSKDLWSLDISCGSKTNRRIDHYKDVNPWKSEALQTQIRRNLCKIRQKSFKSIWPSETFTHVASFQMVKFIAFRPMAIHRTPQDDISCSNMVTAFLLGNSVISDLESKTFGIQNPKRIWTHNRGKR